MSSFSNYSLLANTFMLHNTCYLWNPSLNKIHLISNILIAIAYFSIPVTLIYIFRKRQDISVSVKASFFLFTASLVFCGINYAVDIWIQWHSNYWILVYIRAITAVVSAIAALVLVGLIPQILALSFVEPTVRKLELEATAIEKKKQFLQTLLDSISDSIIACDRDGNITIFNQASQVIFGQLEPSFSEPGLDNKSSTALQKLLLQALNEKPVIDIELVITSKSNREHTLLANGNPIVSVNGDKIGAVVTLKDISNLPKAETPLPLSEELQSVFSTNNSSLTFERKLQTTSDRLSKQLKVMLVDDCCADRAIYRRYLQTDSDYLYTFIETEYGEEACKLYRQERPDFVLLDYMLPDMDGMEWLTLWQQQSYEARPPVIVLTGQGNENVGSKFIELGAASYLEKNRLTSEILRLEVKRVLTENHLFKQNIKKRDRIEQSIRKALEQEKKLNELKTRFVSMTSHEFRTPLASILSSSELLEHYSHKWNEERKLNHLRRIQSCVKHMTGLLNDVLLLGKADAGKLELNSTTFDLYELCKELIEEMELISKTHRIIFSQDGCLNDNRFNLNSEWTDCENERQESAVSSVSNRGFIVCMDKKLLRHILNNLLSNAIKYSPNCHEVYFNVKCDRASAVFQVRDSGIGIPLEEQDRLFDSFHRASNVNSIPGTGLGLPIVKRAVDLHGGTIAMESKLGIGTTFIVTLPYLIDR